MGPPKTGMGLPKTGIRIPKIGVGLPDRYGTTYNMYETT